jgi:hypothetical protein
MKKVILLVLVLLGTMTLSAQTWSKVKRSGAIFLRGFSSPVYRTDAKLKVKNVDDDTEYTVDGGLVYRVLGEEDGNIYVKIMSGIKETSNLIEIDYDGNDTDISNQLFKVATSELKDYNKVWQQGLSWSTLTLPIKYRPETELNGTKYERAFTTDISIGPFFGYKFKTGKFYDQYMKIGAFAGPSLISFPTTVTPNNGSTEQNNVTNDNLIGFSFGWGIVYQFNKLQIGIINGKDYLGGERSKEWQYDGKNWFSFAIGYKFLN